jgi:hypothetical protein
MRLIGVEDPTLSRQSANRWQLSQPNAPVALYPERDPLAVLCLSGPVNTSAMVRLEGSGKLKSSMISSRLEPTTYRLVA